MLLYFKTPAITSAIGDKTVAINAPISLFAHESARILIEAFPRSGSTGVISNLAFSNLGIRTRHGDRDIRTCSPKLIPGMSYEEYKSKAIILRCPINRFESFYLTKLVSGHAKSVITFFTLIYPKLMKKFLTPKYINWSSLNSYFISDKNLDTTSESINGIEEIKEILEEIREQLKELSFKQFTNTIYKYGAPVDHHLVPQSDLMKFKIDEYDRVFRLDNMHPFYQWYKTMTGEEYNLSYNKIQPNNRSHLQYISMDQSITIKGLRLMGEKGFTPQPGTIIDKDSLSLIEEMYSLDLMFLKKAII